jgi:hypothetical protein
MGMAVALQQCSATVHVMVVSVLMLCVLCLPCRYGMGMAVGFTAMLILKKAIRAVPVVGGIAKPFLGGLGLVLANGFWMQRNLDSYAVVCACLCAWLKVRNE